MRRLDPGVLVLGETALADRIRRSTPVVVLFYADWCPFCARFLPVFATRAAALPVAAVAADVSHPQDPRWDAYRIGTIPTLVSFRAGKETGRLEAVAGIGLDEDDLERFSKTLGA